MFDIYIIKQLIDNYSYILRDEENNITCVIDPSCSNKIIGFLELNDWKLDYILNTHHHDDHIGGNKELKNKYNAKIMASIYDQDNIDDIDILLSDNDHYKFPSICNIIHIPGHTNGHIAYYFPLEKFLFSGDTLFSLGCGKIFDGTMSQMFHSLKKLASLPKDTKIYSGHEYTLNNAKFILSINDESMDLYKQIHYLSDNSIPTTGSTIEFELNNNIFLCANNEYIKNRLSLSHLNDIELFTFLRTKKNIF